MFRSERRFYYFPTIYYVQRESCYRTYERITKFNGPTLWLGFCRHSLIFAKYWNFSRTFWQIQDSCKLFTLSFAPEINGRATTDILLNFTFWLPFQFVNLIYIIRISVFFSDNLNFFLLKIRFFLRKSDIFLKTWNFSKNLFFLVFLWSDKSFQVIKVREIIIVKEVKRSDAGDVSPVAVFVFHINCKFGHQMAPLDFFSLVNFFLTR